MKYYDPDVKSKDNNIILWISVLEIAVLAKIVWYGALSYPTNLNKARAIEGINISCRALDKGLVWTIGFGHRA
jgi:hypothetical protein